ncbi:hypothetical protein COCMIDRAFT_35774 [Bipolaris oryzae ATCC 44560]|uniref:Uncharacterized protein n=1 Tax=Bipolaris oryzae ATCC 44560 TaxID=930090 RepID=W6ZA86_COCMI|nr:uncharacterized protein COCMIDRAFT_35774 [Bipolaris oryzae ATCC 44560]EUC46668.1 hypothetical protein COCMIDRAFT_35774 [Bipolaris oryzae ATCC 44560]
MHGFPLISYYAFFPSLSGCHFPCYGITFYKLATYTQQQTSSSSNTLATDTAQGQTSNSAERFIAFPLSSASKKAYPTVFTLPHIGRELRPQEPIHARNLSRAESSITKNNNYSLYTDGSSVTSTNTDVNPEYSISTLLQKLTTFFINFFPRSHTTSVPNHPGTPSNHPHEPPFPPFLLPYTPAPSPYPSSLCSSSSESDKDPTRQKQKQKLKRKRCWVGRPRGAVLRPRDRYYARGLCDKHGNEVLFLENMRIHCGKKGEQGERWYAWRCG